MSYLLRMHLYYPLDGIRRQLKVSQTTVNQLWHQWIQGQIVTAVSVWTLWNSQQLNDHAKKICAVSSATHQTSLQTGMGR